MAAATRPSPPMISSGGTPLVSVAATGVIIGVGRIVGATVAVDAAIAVAVAVDVGRRVAVEVTVLVVVGVIIAVAVAVGVLVGRGVAVLVMTGVSVIAVFCAAGACVAGACVAGALIVSLIAVGAVVVACATEPLGASIFALPIDPSTIKRGAPPMIQPPVQVAPAISISYLPSRALIVCLRPSPSTSVACAACAATLILTGDG